MRDPSHIVPKALAVFALGPFAFGIWWLNWVVTQENLQRSKVFQACLASVTADVDGKRFVECEWAGQRVRAALPTAKPFRSWQAGEQHAVLMDPAPPHSFTNGGLVELWASTGMLSFFGMVLLGSMVFLWRVDPGFRGRPRAARTASPKAALPKRAPPEKSVALPQGTIELRMPASEAKAGVFWMSVMALLALVCLYGVGEGVWLAGIFLLGLLGMIGWLYREWRYTKSFVLRSRGQEVVITSCRGEQSLHAREVAQVEEVRPEVYRCLDEQGRLLLTLRPEMGKAGEAEEVLRRLHPMASQK